MKQITIRTPDQKNMHAVSALEKTEIVLRKHGIEFKDFVVVEKPSEATHKIICVDEHTNRNRTLRAIFYIKHTQ